jgi:O-antigen/teichoic acid export membrane protein
MVRPKFEEFTRNFLTLFTGSTIAQAIVILFTPILSRIYDPADFGVWNLFLSFATTFGVAATLRYELAIVLPKEESDAKAIFVLSIIISIIFSIALFISILILHKLIISIPNISPISDYIYLIPLVVLLTGLYQSLNYWSTRNKSFANNASSRIGQSVGMSLANLGIGLTTKGASGLIWGSILGQFVGVLLFSFKLLRNPFVFFNGVTKKQIIDNRKKYINFARINTPHAILDSLQNSILVFLILDLFSSIILGYYAFAFRILKAPLGLIGAALSQVFFEKASRIIEAGESLHSLFFNLQKKMLILGVVPFLIFFLYAPDLFGFIFSSKYIEAGRITQILIPWLFLNFLLSPFSNLPIVLNRQKGAFVITIIDFLIKVISIIIGGVKSDYILGFTLLSAGSCILHIVSNTWYYYIIKKGIQSKY